MCTLCLQAQKVTVIILYQVDLRQKQNYAPSKISLLTSDWTLGKPSPKHMFGSILH